MGIGIVLAFPLAAFADCPDGIVAYYKLDRSQRRQRVMPITSPAMTETAPPADPVLHSQWSS